MTRKRRDLTAEEKALWNRATQKTRPLPPEKKRAAVNSSKGSPLPDSPSPKKASFLAPREPPLSSLSASALSTRRIHRLRKVTLEGRIDLHGLTHAQARLRLIQFLISHQNQGCLWVLAITGKGRHRLNSAAPYDEGPLRQTLQILVPQWLEEASLRSLVSAYATAKPRDGGNGALYIRLKRLKG